ncbi:TPA: DUF1642 domain-containing protein, partial [Streptococcus suis]|nr:DUF1642 domain-containing protein [Streptococcus suis]
KFVAEWIKGYRHTNTVLKILNAAENERVIPSAVNDWILDNQRDFVVAWHDGYEIEQEKLYTVEIPNPNANGYSRLYLSKDAVGKVQIYIFQGYTSTEFADNWKKGQNAQLTESEIKQDFEWAWDAGFYEPVEVE